MKHLLLYFILFITASAAAQDQWPEPFIINDSLPMYENLPDENYQQLNTGEDEVSFKEILSPKYQKFISPEDIFPGIGQKNHVWVRYRLKNSTLHPKIITFAVDKNEEHIYVKEKNKWKHFVSGEMVPWSKRDGIRDLSQIQYTLAPGQEIQVYVNLGDVIFNTDSSRRIGNFIKIIEDKFVEKHNYDTDDVISFGFFGFIIFAVIFNLFFYYVNREKVYLVYSFLLVFSAFLLAETVLSSTVFAEHRDAYGFFMSASITLFIVTLLHTVRFFFRVNVHFPGWDKFLVYFSIYIAISGTLIYLSFVNRWIVPLIVVGTIAGLAAIVFIIAAIIMIVKLLRKKTKKRGFL